MGQKTHEPSSDVPSIIFFSISSYRHWAFKMFYFYFCKVIKRIDRIFAKNLARNYEKYYYSKHQMLGQ